MVKGKSPLLPRDMARILGVSQKTVHRWVKEGLFLKYGIQPWFTPAGDPRFDPDEVERAIEASRQRGSDILRDLVSEMSLVNLDKSRVIVVANQKGGVGKTTVAVGLAEAIALMGYRVLLIDADPQGNCTAHLGYSLTRAEDYFRRYEHALADIWRLGSDSLDLPLKDVLLPCDHAVETDRLWLVPNDDSGVEVDHAITVTVLRLAAMSASLDGKKLSQVLGDFYATLPLKLEELLAEIPFDFVIVDTNPSLGPLTTSALLAADTYIVPVEPEAFSSEGMLLFRELVNQLLAFMDKELEPLGYIVNNKSRQAKVREEIAEMMNEFFGDKALPSLPEDVTFVEAQKLGKGIQAYRPQAKGARAMMELAEEVVRRLGVAEQQTAVRER